MSRLFDRAAPARPAVADSMQPGLAHEVVQWQRTHGRRGLPWQGSRDPYRVWLSEIMLQQTQVSTVLGYYQAFLARFADVQALAAAPLDDVLAAWAGLGYYSRARNLHRCAQAVVAQHGGAFPRSAAALAELPGIGPSTAAAIASFCWGERVAILDGNVKRVLSRVLAFGGDLADKSNERALWSHATALLPEAGDDMPAYTQGLMDLGATLCTVRQANCLLCPLQQRCAARLAGTIDQYPVKTRRLTRRQRENWWLWLTTERAGQTWVWCQQRPSRGVWAGLWTLPLFDDQAALMTEVTHVGASVELVQPLPTIRHALTHFDWVLHPRRVTVVQAGEPSGEGRWLPVSDLAAHAMPSPLRKLLGVG